MGARFQVLFHSPPGVLFTFPSRYLSTIGHRRVFRLGWWSTPLRTGFHVPGPTRDRLRARAEGCAYGAVTLCRRPSQAVRLPLRATAGPGRTRSPHPATPAGESTAVRARPPVWPWPPSARRYSGDLAVDFFSSGYLDVSVPRVVLPQGMCSQGGCRNSFRRVRPFGDPRVEGCVPLTADYRSLPRPSSASCAKASAARPAYLLKKTLCRGGPVGPRVSHTPAPIWAPAIRCCDLTLYMVCRRIDSKCSLLSLILGFRESVSGGMFPPVSLCGSQGTRGDVPRGPGTAGTALAPGTDGAQMDRTGVRPA